MRDITSFYKNKAGIDAALALAERLSAQFDARFPGHKGPRFKVTVGGFRPSAALRKRPAARQRRATERKPGPWGRDMDLYLRIEMMNDTCCWGSAEAKRRDGARRAMMIRADLDALDRARRLRALRGR